MSTRISNKRIFYDLASMGLCGNTMLTWRTLDDYWPHRHRYPMIGVRRITPGAKGNYKLHYEELHDVLLNVPSDDYIISGIPGANHKGGLQGELSWINGSWYLYYSHRSGLQRDVLRINGNHAKGWQVIRLLRYHLTPSDYDDLIDLFHYYTIDGEFPTIEFAVLKNPGPTTIKSRNAVIWEIRHY